MKAAHLVGGVTAALSHDDAPAGSVASLRVDRCLKSGLLDAVWVDEAKLAEIVADGAAILARLAKERSR